MSAVTVDQFVPSITPGDATTGHTLQVQRLLRDMGYESEIYVLAMHAELEGRALIISQRPGAVSGERYVIYQYSAVSGLADTLIGQREPAALAYHNITPPHLLWAWERGTALALCAAEVQVAQLAPWMRMGICVSAFNAADLAGRGFAVTPVAPVLVDVAEFDAEPDPTTSAALERARAGGGAQWLFVGTIAPHKAQHRLVQALAAYRRVYDPAARLALVGRPVVPAYAAALRRLVHELGLDDAVELPGRVTHEQLVAYYRGTDVFVGLSEHEGFCVPLLEAMHHGVPVIAYGAGAVPETLGTGGLLLDDPAPHAVAAAVARVVGDGGTRARLADAGRARAAHFSLERTRAALAGIVRQWVATGGEPPLEGPEHETASTRAGSRRVRRSPPGPGREVRLRRPALRP